MKPNKQPIYLPVKVEDELPSEYARISLSMDDGKTFPYETAFVRWLDYKKEGYTHWLKPQEAFVFTPEQLNEYTQNVIKQALEIAAESKCTYVKVDLDGRRTHPIGLCKESITKTVEETFKKFEV